MADRTVVYRLQADATQLKAQMAAAAASTRKAAGEMGGALNTEAKKGAAALDGLGINAGTVALAVGTTVVMATANFEKAMSGVQAATHESAAGMNALREAALDAGASTSFSASEAAAGIENLAKAGLSTKDILDGGLAGALDLAAAGNMQVADAAEAAAGAMAQFKLEGDQATHVADLLAAGAGKAQGDVSDMVMALKQAGTVSAQTGLSLEETVGALSAMAEQSLLGSDAGTSFKTMLAALTPNSKKAADAMERYNINAFDAQGNFVGMTELAGQLQAGLSGLTDEQRAMALETIFGSDAVRAASIVYDNGAEGIANWTAKVNDAGYAAETAAIQLDNLQGDVEALKGALQTAFIQSGSESQGMLRGITQLATDTVNLTTEAEKADGALGGLRDSALGALNPLGSLGSMYNGIKGELSGADEKSKDLDKSTSSLAQSSAAASGGLDAQAVSLEGVGGAIKQTAVQTEAAEKALKQARDAAGDTATSFVNLGDDVDSAKVSLGQWIKQMAEQADALNNFMDNAKSASKRGLRDGLIKDLQDAGPAGALRMKQLANATDEEIARANKAWARGQKAIQDYINFKVPPKKIEVDQSGALSAIQIIRNALKNIPDESVVVRVTRSGTGAQSPGFGPQMATGGRVSGPGTATSDSIPAYLSNGEYVIKAAAVDRYGVHMFDRLNAMHFATGGSADRKKRRRRSTVEFESASDYSPSEQALAQAAEATEQFYADQARALREADERAQRQAEIAEAVLAGQQRAWEQATDAAKSQVDAAEAMVDSVQANMDRIGQAATSMFSGSWFSGGDQRHGLWTGPGGGAAGDWRTRAQESISGLQERGALISQLSGLGLSGAALEDLLGNQSNAGIAEMIARGEIADFNALFTQQQALLASVRAQAGQAGYGADMAAANAQLATMNAQFAALTAAIEAARPITVLEAISAQETARELARLLSMTGGA